MIGKNGVTQGGIYMAAPGRCVPVFFTIVFVAAFTARVSGEISPENVLVLYNEASAEGTAVANYYAGVRGIPGNQIVGLGGLDLDEQITANDYLSIIRPQVLAALTPSIEVIVTTKGLPLRIYTPVNPGSYTDPFDITRPAYTLEAYSSLESELMQVDKISTPHQMADQTWWMPPFSGTPDYPHHARNLYYKAGVSLDQTDASFNHTDYDYTFEDNVYYGPRVLTSRLDGFTVGDITASIDRAQQAFIGPNCFVVDNDPTATGSNFMQPLIDNVLAPAVPYTYDNTDTFITDAPGPVIGYVSHGTHDGPDGYLVDEEVGLTFDLADGAVFHTWESYNAYSFEEGGNRNGQGLVAEWIARGGTVGVGHVEEPAPHLNPTTNEDVMFDMLLHGYTWAEAAWGATQQLSFVNTVVGDPLMVFRELILGDANKDGKVGSMDLTLLSINWGVQGDPGGAMWGKGDFNGDGLVGSMDLTVLSTHWGDTADWYVGGYVQAIPEPSTLMLAVAGIATLFGYVWRWRGRPSV